MSTPKTIQIYLPGGEPRGIRIAEITTRIVQVIEIPRSLLQDFIAMPESGQVGIYFLCGEDEDDNEKRLYIGQTGELRTRLASHNQKKDFWSRALVLISRTNSLTQTHALFLEWYCIQQAQEAGRFTLENGTGGSRPHTPAPLEADCMEIFETGRWLLSTLGFPFFDSIGSSGTAASDDTEMFFCTSAGIKGQGRYTEEGFVVLKGSVGRSENVPSLTGTSLARFREKLLASGTMVVDGDTVVFQKDHLFGSPSMAAIALLGRRSNGWMEWKDESGRTLDELKRQAPGEE